VHIHSHVIRPVTVYEKSFHVLNKSVSHAGLKMDSTPLACLGSLIAYRHQHPMSGWQRAYLPFVQEQTDTLKIVLLQKEVRVDSCIKTQYGTVRCLLHHDQALLAHL